MAYDAKVAGENIRRERLARRLSQRALGKLVGCSKATIANYEDGKTDPDAETSCALADLFDMPLDELFGRKRKEVEFD